MALPLDKGIVLRSNYYVSKVNHLKQTKPSQWQSVVKWIADIVLAPGSEPLFANLQIEIPLFCLTKRLLAKSNAAFLQIWSPSKGLNPSRHTVRICHS